MKMKAVVRMLIFDCSMFVPHKQREDWLVLWISLVRRLKLLWLPTTVSYADYEERLQ